jgi:hypothetical protein
VPQPTTIPWLRTLLLALPLLLLLLAGAWLLRQILPDDPALALATREGPPAPAAGCRPTRSAAGAKGVADHPRKRAPGRCSSSSAPLMSESEKARRRLQAARASQPPQVAVAPPPPSAGPAQGGTCPGADAVRHNPAQATVACALPSGPTNDYSFMQWMLAHRCVSATRRSQMQPGVSSYCFDSSGSGALEWRRGRTACRTRAQARFDGSNLAPARRATRPATTVSHWYADQLVCANAAPTMWRNAAAARAAAPFGPDQLVGQTFTSCIDRRASGGGDRLVRSGLRASTG